MSATFIPLIDGPGLMLAYNISRQGDVVVGEVPPVDMAHGPGGFARLANGQWKVTQLPVFPTPEGHSSPAFGVNGQHEIVGYSPNGDPALDTPYLWTPGNPAQLNPLNMFPGHKVCLPYAISANGNTIVGYGCSERSDRFGAGDPFHHALVWDGGGAAPQEIDTSPIQPEEDVAVCISSSGHVAAGFACTPESKHKLYDPLTFSRGHEPIVWRKGPLGTYHRGFLPSAAGFEHSGRVVSINEEGDRLAGFVGVRAQSLPAVWTIQGKATHIQTLDNLPGYPSGRASGVSADGNVVTGNSLRGDDDHFESHAFIWRPVHGTRDLVDELVNAGAVEAKGWTLFDALGLSGDGRSICGNGLSPAGDLQAWVAQLG